jgi:hypothetical protein
MACRTVPVILCVCRRSSVFMRGIAVVGAVPVCVVSRMYYCTYVDRVNEHKDIPVNGLLRASPKKANESVRFSVSRIHRLTTYLQNTQ